MRWAIACLLLGLGCNRDALPGPEGDGGALDGRAGDADCRVPCSRATVSCVHHCNDDGLAEPFCVDGHWRCDAGRFLDTRCQPGGCGCSGDYPLCTYGCGSGWLVAPVCTSTGWKCSDEYIDSRMCVGNTCWGPALPGERCGPGGWECKPEDDDYAPCFQYLCAECKGFTGPVETASCRCECMGTNVICRPR